MPDSERTVIERRDPLIGTVLDRRFRIDFRLAAGGFGAIYRATHLQSNHEIALKVLHPDLALDPRVIARFRREGATLANLRNPHTITAYELGEAPDGTLYIVMELLHGETLFDRIHLRGPLPWKMIVKIARAVCGSLAEAHALGIIHRDLKPSNIHLERRGNDLDFAKVLDFGIAKILQGSGLDNSDLTHAGQMIGTFDYMAPEQLVGGQCTPATDIYTLAVVMYEAICGQRPFGDVTTPTAMLAAVLTRTPPQLACRATIPMELDRIVMRCLSREPKDRYASVADLARALDAVAHDEEAVTLAAPNARPDTNDDATQHAPRSPAGRYARGSAPAMIEGPQPVMGVRGSHPMIDPSWPPPQQPQPMLPHAMLPQPMSPPRGYPPPPTATYDMSRANARDVMVRRIVLASAILITAIIALILTSRL
jgi:serine/threonine-protein kinase